MGRSHYKIHEPTHPHFITCTVLHWIPIFTRPQSVQIVLDSLAYLQAHDNLKIYAYVILENHLHMVASSNDLPATIKRFKSFTAKQLLQLLQDENVKTILDQLGFIKRPTRAKRLTSCGKREINQNFCKTRR